MSGITISATEFMAEAEKHIAAHRSVKLDAVLKRCNETINAKVVAFRHNKGLNDIGMLMRVQYMPNEREVIHDVVAHLEAAGYKVRLTEEDSRDEDTYWLNIAVS